MRLRFCCLSLVLFATTAASVQAGLTAAQLGGRLVLLNETGAPVTLDSIRIASTEPGDSYRGSIRAEYVVSAEGERVAGGFSCSPFFGPNCQEGKPALFGRDIAPGDSVRFVSFEVSCDVCRGLARRDVRDTMRVYAGGSTMPLNVGMPDELFVASETALAATALRLDAAPNPSRGASVVVLSRPQAGPVRVAAYDAVGREVAVLHDGQAPAPLTLRLDTSAWPPGVYVVRASAGGGTASVRLAVTR